MKFLLFLLVNKVTICEGKTRLIACSHNRALNIIYANYGRTRGKSVCPHRSIRTTRCFNRRKSLTRVRRLCQGKRRCLLRATNRQFGDPCPGTYKYLRVFYKCVPSEFHISYQQVVVLFSSNKLEYHNIANLKTRDIEIIVIYYIVNRRFSLVSHLILKVINQFHVYVSV